MTPSARAEWTDEHVWAYLAKRWAAAATQGGCRARILRERPIEFCGSLLALERQGRITRDARLRLLGEMQTHPESRPEGWWWPFTARGAASRAAFCQRLSRAARQKR